MTDTTLPTIDPRHTALLVMDYQPGILGSLDDAAALLARAADAIAIVRRQGALVAYVRVAFEAADIEAVPAHSRFAPILAASGERLRSDSPLTAVHEAVAPEPGDIVVRKTRVGAFSTTDLGEQLRARGITTLILAGVSTSGVVLSTLRDASDQDYELIVLADACADPDAETHAFLTGTIFPRQASVVTVGQFADLLSRSE